MDEDEDAVAVSPAKPDVVLAWFGQRPPVSQRSTQPAMVACAHDNQTLPSVLLQSVGFLRSRGSWVVPESRRAKESKGFADLADGGVAEESVRSSWRHPDDGVQNISTRLTEGSGKRAAFAIPCSRSTSAARIASSLGTGH